VVLPGILAAVAKVMISMPDELLARVDAEAERSKRSRSAVIREFAAAGLEDRSAALAERMRALNVGAKPRGGDVVSQLKSSRPN
jgi:metal-responsive CopG/Arc/MetJ family transcriptional regulator